MISPKMAGKATRFLKMSTCGIFDGCGDLLHPNLDSLPVYTTAP